MNDFDAGRLKPISEGLGLNHFADGLPYTPASTRRRPNPPVPAMVQFQFPTKPQNPEVPVELAQPLSVVDETIAASPSGRIGAYLIDILVLMVGFTGVVSSAFSINGYKLEAVLNQKVAISLLSPLAALFLVLYMSYFLIQELAWRTTLGKSVFGIAVECGSSFGVIARNVLFFASALPFAIGLIWAFFDDDRRCWHDMVSGARLISRS